MPTKTSGAAAKRRERKHRAISRNALTTSKNNPNLLTQVVEPWMPLFPPRTTRMLRYSASTSLTATSGVPATYVVRANDAFDPDYTSGGHQPMGFDQMMVFYNHFCVTDARLIATFRATGAACYACIRQDAIYTPLTVIDRIIEIGGTVMTSLETKSTSGDAKTIELSIDIARLQGLSKAAITADPTLRGDAATSPSEVTYFHVQLWDASGVTSTAEVSLILEQRVIFMEPRDQTESFSAGMRELYKTIRGDPLRNGRESAFANMSSGERDYVTVRVPVPLGSIVSENKKV
jgi:hypothetical protein